MGRKRGKGYDGYGCSSSCSSSYDDDEIKCCTSRYDVGKENDEERNNRALFSKDDGLRRWFLDGSKKCIAVKARL